MEIQQRGFELVTKVLGCWGRSEAWSDDILSPGDESRGRGQARIGPGADLGRTGPHNAWPGTRR